MKQYRRGILSNRTSGYFPTVWGCKSRSNGLGNLLNLTNVSVPVSDAAMQVVGMFIAVVSGSSLNWAVNKLKLFQENPAVRNLIMSIAGTGLALKLPALLKMIGMDSLAISLETNPKLNNILKGATTMFGFATAMSGIGIVADKTGINLPFIANETNLLSQINESRGVSGVFGEGDFATKLESLKSSLAEAEADFAKVATPMEYDKQETMSYIRNMLGYAKINIANAETYIKEGKYSFAEKDMSSAKEYILTTKAFLAGLTATAIVPADMTQPVATPGEVIITNTETGEKAAVVPPETPAEVAVVTEGGQTAGAFSVELIEGWANYIAPQLGWTPAQVIASYLLRYLANNGYVWAYGRNPVQAFMPTTSGADTPALISYDSKLYEVNSYDGVVELVRTIKGF